MFIFMIPGSEALAMARSGTGDMSLSPATSTGNWEGQRRRVTEVFRSKNRGLDRSFSSGHNESKQLAIKRRNWKKRRSSGCNVFW